MRILLERTFELSKRETSIKQEIVAGCTTFLAMAYITIVNPSILSDAGMDFGGVFVATCLAAAIGSLIMGVMANYPIALAPGMGQNAFFAYTIVIGMGHSWQTALATVFISGCLFILISLLPIRELIINSIPKNLKHAITSGIGLFLAFIAFQNAALVQDDLSTLVGTADLASAAPLLALLGLFLIVALDSRKIPGAIVIGLLTVSLLGWISGLTPFTVSWTVLLQLPQSFCSWTWKPPWTYLWSASYSHYCSLIYLMPQEQLSELQIEAVSSIKKAKSIG